MIARTLVRESVPGDAIPPRDPIVGLMGSGYRIEHLCVDGLEIAAVTLSGSISTANLVLILNELERIEPAAVLIDESMFKASLITPVDIQQLARRWATAGHLRGVAIAVIAPNPVIYGLNRMFQLLTESDPRLGVFWNRAAALDWLGQSTGSATSDVERRRQA